jgi:GNAT superfamily N-acetyltransferase
MNYLIRALTVHELYLCEPFGQAFIKEKGLPGPFDAAHFNKNWTMLLQPPYRGQLLGLWHDEALVGGIGGIIAPDMNTAVDVLNEFFWYVDPAHRMSSYSVRLMSQFKMWGIHHGAKRWRMVHLLSDGETEDPTSVRLAEFYKKRGFRPIEVTYDQPIGGL